jgi:hypothetical protein
MDQDDVILRALAIDQLLAEWEQVLRYSAWLQATVGDLLHEQEAVIHGAPLFTPEEAANLEALAQRVERGEVTR